MIADLTELTLTDITIHRPDQRPSARKVKNTDHLNGDTGLSSLTSKDRPQIFAYDSAASFIADMLRWRFANDSQFSIAKEVAALPACSPALVTRVSKGLRRLTRDKVPAFSHLLGLTIQEGQFLDHLASRSVRAGAMTTTNFNPSLELKPPVSPRNNLFSHWLNIYVKDTCSLKGFKPDPQVIHQLLGGIASVEDIAESLDFLRREGFLLEKPNGEIVASEPHSVSSDGIPNTDLSAFHRQALQIAHKGIDTYTVQERRAETFVFPLNESRVAELQRLLRQCMDQVVAFSDKHQDDDECLYQVVIHLTPIGKKPPNDQASATHEEARQGAMSK